MSELLKIESKNFSSGQKVQTVNARELHAFLGIGKDFSTWIKDRIEQYEFVESQDFEVFPDFGENSKGGRPTKEYAIILDMAKELAMVERNDKGKQARQYFIECERRAKNPTDPMQVLNDPAAMRGLLLNYSEKVLTLENKVDELEPKAKALDHLATVTNGALCLLDTAKTLNVQPKRFFLIAQKSRWIYRRAHGKNYVAYQDKIQSGYLEHKVTTIERSDGSEKVVEQVLVTPKGLAKLGMIFANSEATI